MTDSLRLLVIGASGHARVVLDAIERSGAQRVVGLIDSFRRIGEVESGYRILGAEADIVGIVRDQGVGACFVAIGDNWQRHLAVRRIRERLPGMAFATVVHPSAQLGRGVLVGEGSVVMPGAIANAGAKIAEFCIVNTAASLDHDGLMEAFSSLAPGARIGGNARIASFASVGIGASVSHARSVGAHSVIGAGAVVVSDIPEHTVAYGVPARAVRARAVGDPYL